MQITALFKSILAKRITHQGTKSRLPVFTRFYMQVKYLQVQAQPGRAYQVSAIKSYLLKLDRLKNDEIHQKYDVFKTIFYALEHLQKEFCNDLAEFASR